VAVTGVVAVVGWQRQWLGGSGSSGWQSGSDAVVQWQGGSAAGGPWQGGSGGGLVAVVGWQWFRWQWQVVGWQWLGGSGSGWQGGSGSSGSGAVVGRVAEWQWISGSGRVAVVQVSVIVGCGSAQE
jgi:hypothetical protein